MTHKSNRGNMTQEIYVPESADDETVADIIIAVYENSQ